MIKRFLLFFLLCCYYSFGQGSYIEAGVNNTSYTFSSDYSSDEFELDSSTGIFLRVGLGVSNPNAAVSDSQIKMGHFYVEANTTLTIKGYYYVNGYNNYQGKGGNWGSFDVAFYR